MNHAQTLGLLGEQLAAKYLIKRGFAIRQTNFHTREGEIDIIAEKNNALHFIEVKTRTNDSFGSPEEAVDEYKLEKIIAAGFCYLDKNELELDWQIDVIAIAVDGKNKNALVRHLRDLG